MRYVRQRNGSIANLRDGPPKSYAIQSVNTSAYLPHPIYCPSSTPILIVTFAALYDSLPPKIWS